MGHYFWIITKVLGACREETDEIGVSGPRGASKEGKTVAKTFRMYDDDGECYYEGELHLKDEDSDDEEAMFGPLEDFGMPNAGCTVIAIWEQSKPEMEGTIMEPAEDGGYWVML